jgi:hypothetical protein
MTVTATAIAIFPEKVHIHHLALFIEDALLYTIVWADDPKYASSEWKGTEIGDTKGVCSAPAIHRPQSASLFLQSGFITCKMGIILGSLGLTGPVTPEKPGSPKTLAPTK